MRRRYRALTRFTDAEALLNLDTLLARYVPAAVQNGVQARLAAAGAPLERRLAVNAGP